MLVMMISTQFIVHTILYSSLIFLCLRQQKSPQQVADVKRRSLAEINTTCTGLSSSSGKSMKSIAVWPGTYSIGLEKGHSYGQLGQDIVVSTLLGCLKGGFFIDLAANDAVILSNTAMLETTLDWNGICIEPNAKYWKRLAHRKCQVVGAVVGAHDDDVVGFISNDVRGGIEGVNNAKYGKHRERKDIKAERNAVISFTSLLRTFNAPSVIDYLSLDIEGAETLVMKSFPFHAYRIRILTVERPDQELQNLLKNNGYIFALRLGPLEEEVFVHESEAAALNMLSKLPNFGVHNPKIIFNPLGEKAGSIFYRNCGVNKTRAN